MTESHSITCSECQARLDEFALDDLPPGVSDAIARHLADGCSDCNRMLAEIAADLGQLAHTLGVEAPPMRVERALLNRIAAGQLRREASAPSIAAESSPTLAAKSSSRAILAAAITLAATIFGIAAWTTRHHADNNLADQPAPWPELQRRVAEADAAQRFSSIPQLRFASLKMPAKKISADGYVVQDRLAKQWHVYAFHLPTLPTGRVYQLWFDLGDSHFVRAGLADIDGDGTVSCVIEAPSDRSAIRGLAISDEPGTGSDSPTGDSLVESPLP